MVERFNHNQTNNTVSFAIFIAFALIQVIFLSESNMTRKVSYKFSQRIL